MIQIEDCSSQMEKRTYAATASSQKSDKNNQSGLEEVMNELLKVENANAALIEEVENKV